jgi:malate dehydrogenase (oxaloacetate-decarboxylating)(NADP+)
LSEANQALINDLLYLGLRQPRVSAAELDAFVDEVMLAVQEVFPAYPTRGRMRRTQ